MLLLACSLLPPLAVHKLDLLRECCTLTFPYTTVLATLASHKAQGLDTLVSGSAVYRPWLTGCLVTDRALQWQENMDVTN
jgi:hypothetical protein